MGQLISLYNHPDYTGDNLDLEDYELVKDIFYVEDDINRENDVETTALCEEVGG